MDKSKFLTGSEPVEREVTLPDGSVEKLYFMVPTAADARRWGKTHNSDSEESFYAMQRLIAASLYDVKKKKLALVGEEYKQLTYEGCESLLPHVLEIAGLTTEKKSSPSADENTSDAS